METYILKDEQILLNLIKEITNKNVIHISYIEVKEQEKMIQNDKENIYLSTNYLIRLNYDVYEYQYAIFYKNIPLGIKYIDFMNIDMIKENEKEKEEQFKNKIIEFVKKYEI